MEAEPDKRAGPISKIEGAREGVGGRTSSFRYWSVNPVSSGRRLLTGWAPNGAAGRDRRRPLVLDPTENVLDLAKNVLDPTENKPDLTENVLDPTENKPGLTSDQAALLGHSLVTGKLFP